MLIQLRPNCRVDHITEIPLEDLKNIGIRGLLIDVDNTVSPWGIPEVSPAIGSWLNNLAGLGFSFCLVSNTFESRTKKVALQVNAPYVFRAMKPCVKGYLTAMNKLGLLKSEVVVVGDQMITDILGAKRCGILSIWVRPLTKREFVTTKVNRVLEQIVFFVLKKRGLLLPVGEFRK